MNNMVDEKNGRTALWLGIASFLTAWIPLLGLVFGWISLIVGRKSTSSNHKFWAITGIVLNVLVMLLLIALIVGGVILVNEYLPEIEACIQNNPIESEAERCVEELINIEPSGN